MWKPTIDATSDKKLYLQICDSVAQAIVSGELKRGEQLPTVRALSALLNVTPGTINRAFDEGVQRGIIEKTQGKGTFVKQQKQGRTISAAMLPGRKDVFDFTLNQPACLNIEPILSTHLQNLARQNDPRLWSVYGDTRGLPEHRESMADWLNLRGNNAAPENLFLLAGAQQGLLSSLMLLCNKGDTVMVQETTFPGIRAVATLLGLQLQPVAMDECGLDLNDFKARCKQATSQVLVILPTAHNPTGKTLSQSHREKLVKIARKYDIYLVEDDIYLHAEPVVSLQQLAPERTFHVSGFSKCVAPALRAGMLVCPPQFTGSLARVIQAQNWFTPPVTTELAHRLYTSGDAVTIEQARREDCIERIALAKAILGEKRIQYDPVNLHIWLKHSPRLDNAAVISRLNQLGVDALPSVFFHVTETSSAHLRLCLGNLTPENLQQGLEIIARELNPSLPERAII